MPVIRAAGIREAAPAAARMVVVMTHNILEHAIPVDIFQELTQLVKNSPWKHGWHSNRSIGFPHWNVDYAGANAANGLDISDRIHGRMRDAWQYLESTHFPGARLVRCYANSHTYGIEGYPHQDSRRANERTVVVYCNPKWRREWGGETLLYDQDNIVLAQLPHYNTALIFDSRQWHCARGVTRICPELRITLMFKLSLGEFDTMRDNIQMFLQRQGGDHMHHGSANLTRHLLSVYDRLKEHGEPNWVCQAGAVHSVFGTNQFKHKLLITPEQRQELSVLIDAQALVVVDLFSCIDRPQILEQWIRDNTTVIASSEGVPATRDQILALLAIECANLEDQDSLQHHPELQQWWNRI
jgi:hypothetical protein